MSCFDFYGEKLFEEAKFFLEKAKGSDFEDEKKAYLDASLLLGMSALEAYVNSIAVELCETFVLSEYEKSILSEKDIKIINGKVTISNSLKMSRLIDRIELIFCKYSHKNIEANEPWNMGIKQSIDLRNKLVHPKETLELSYSQVEKALKSILDTINELYLAVYKKKVPNYNYGLQSVKI